MLIGIKSVGEKWNKRVKEEEVGWGGRWKGEKGEGQENVRQIKFHSLYFKKLNIHLHTERLADDEQADVTGLKSDAMRKAVEEKRIGERGRF